eukprot:scaffold840_cov344-Pavlova_lutheri.AAC.99
MKDRYRGLSTAIDPIYQQYHRPLLPSSGLDCNSARLHWHSAGSNAYHLKSGTKHEACHPDHPSTLAAEEYSFH